VLTASATDPTTSDAGVFAGQVLALQLNVDFSDAGKIDAGLGDLVYTNPGDSLDGKTVREILAIANDVLGGGTPPAGYTVSGLNDLLDHLNKAFDNGTMTGWAEQHLQDTSSCVSALPAGAKVYVKLDNLPPVEMVPINGHYKAGIPIVPGCYDWEIYYVVDAQPPVTMLTGHECIQADKTNDVTWPCLPEIGVEKDGPVMASPGQMITYTYDVTNHATTPLSNVGISDNLAENERPVLNGLFNVGDTNTNNLLDPGEVWKFLADYTLPAATPSNPGITNVVTASGTGCDKTVTAKDDYTLYPFILRKDVLLYWEGSSVQYDDPNTLFQFNVLQNGVLLTPTPLQISESAPVAFWFREGIYQIQEVNVPQGYEPAYGPTLTITIPMGWPDFGMLNIIGFDLGIVKTGPDCAFPGDQITFNYAVTNSGPASVKPVVTDETLGIDLPAVPQSGDTDGDTYLDPTETWHYSLTTTMPQVQDGFENTARVKEPNAKDFVYWWKGGDKNPANDVSTWETEICETGSICGEKRQDTVSGTALDDWTIQLYKDVNGNWVKVDEKATANGGKYCFNDLVWGDYRVQEVLQTGWSRVTPVNPDYLPVTIDASHLQNIGKNFVNEQACTITKTFDLTVICNPGGFENGEYVTYSKGGWSGGGTAGQLLLGNFGTVYAPGPLLEIGVPGNDGASPYSIKFTDVTKVQAFLTSTSGGSGPLDDDYVNPPPPDAKDTGSGNLGTQILALTLAVDFSDAGLLPAGYGDLVLVNTGKSLDGKTVRQVLDAANQAIGTGTAPSGYSWSELNSLIEALNLAFHEGNVGTFATEHLMKNCPPDNAVYYGWLKTDSTDWNPLLTEILPPPPTGRRFVGTVSQLCPGSYQYQFYYKVGSSRHDLSDPATETISADKTNVLEWTNTDGSVGGTQGLMGTSYGGQELGLMGSSMMPEETSAPEVTGQVVEEVTTEATPEVTGQVVEEVTTEATPEVTGQVVEEVTTEANHEVTGQVVEEVTTEPTPTPVEEPSAPPTG
jgi:uncharacterized repeat protein (TIGR01451 family)